MRIKFKYQYGVPDFNNFWMQGTISEQKFEKLPSFVIPEDFEMDFVPRVFDNVDITGFITEDQFNELRSILKEKAWGNHPKEKMWGSLEMNNFGMEYDFPAKVVEVIIRKDEKGFYNEVHLNLAMFVYDSPIMNPLLAVENELIKEEV